MWTSSNRCCRVIAGVATAGVVAVTAGGVTAIPAAAAPGALPPAPVLAPVELTALSADSSLMDIFGDLTGLSFLIPFLDDPENPLFPIVLSFEALGELFVVMPLVLVVGTPLLLITEGAQGIQDAVSLLGTAVAGVTTLFDGIVDWYQTHNALTGALLDAGSSDVFMVGLDDVLTGFELGDLIT